MKSYIFPLLLTLFSGMSTLLGGFITFFVKRDNLKALSIGLGFSAGVMVYVSLNELISESSTMLGSFMENNYQKYWLFRDLRWVLLLLS